MSSSSTPSGDSTADADASKKPPTKPPTSDIISFVTGHSRTTPGDRSAPDADGKILPTSDKISLQRVYTRDIFKATNPTNPEEQQKKPKNAGRQRVKRRKISKKVEEGKQAGGQEGKTNSSKSIEEGKQEGETGEDKPATKKPTKKPKKPNETKSRIKRVPVAPAVPSTTRRVATTPRAKPPTLTARQAGKRSSRGNLVRKPIGPPKPLNIEVESTIVDGLKKEDIDFKGKNSISTRISKM